MDSQENIGSNSEPIAIEQPPSAHHSGVRKMDRSLAHSLAWKAAGDWFSQIFSWASLLIIVRLLSPADFGTVGMGIVLLPYLRYLGAFGVPRIIVNFRDLTRGQIAQLNTLSVALGLTCFSLATVLAHPVSLFFRDPHLTPVVIVTSLSLIPWGFSAVPEGLIDKEMRFRQASIYDALFAMTAAAVTLIMAYMGFRYWALVCGNVVAAVVRSGLIVAARPHSYAVPRLRELRQPLLFGWHVVVSLVSLNAYSTLDNVTVGRVLGRSALGFYGLAWTLANLPLEKVTSLVTTVVPSYLAVVQETPSEIRRYIRTLTEALSLITFPATVGLALVAKELIPLALGHKWDGVVRPLQILSFYAAFRSIVALLPKVLTAVGNARFVMWVDLFALMLMPTAFYIGAHRGIAGVAWAWVFAYPLVAGLMYRKTFTVTGMKITEYVRALRPAFDGTVVMSTFVLLLKFLTPQNVSGVARLIMEITIGVTVYTATVFLLHRERARAFLRLSGNLKRSRHQQ